MSEFKLDEHPVSEQLTKSKLGVPNDEREGSENRRHQLSGNNSASNSLADV